MRDVPVTAWFCAISHGREREKERKCLPARRDSQAVRQSDDAVAGKPKVPLYKATYLFCEKKDTFLRSTGTFIYEVRHTHIL
jgi:hypothetical protein